MFQMPRVLSVAETKYRDGKSFSLEMRYRADQEVSFHWVVNSAGKIVSAEKVDAYARNPDLPRLETFRLGPLPPIRDDDIPD